MSGDDLVTAMELLSIEDVKQVESNDAIAPSLDPGLDIFRPSPVDIGIKDTRLIEYSPLAAVSQGGVIQFHIPSTNLYWLSFNKSWLKIKAKLLRASNDSAILESDKVSVINALGQTMWKQCDISLQQKGLSNDIGPLYCYKAILDMLAYTPQEYLQTGMQSALYYKDTPGAIDSVDISDNGTNKGLVARREFVKTGEFMMTAALNHDLAHIDRFLPPGIEIKVSLYRNPGEYVIMAPSATEIFRLKITECTLFMHAADLSNGAIIKQHELLNSNRAFYYYKRSILKSFTIPSGVTSWSITQPFGTIIPVDCIFCFVPTLNFQGAQNKNPHFFAHLNINQLQFRAEGYQTQVYILDFSQNHLSELYQKLYEPDFGHMHLAGALELKDLKGDQCLYRIKLGNASHERFFRAKHGQTHFGFTTTKALDKSYTLIAYARLHDFFAIDNFKNIYTSDQCF